jgi:hypothetical protein
VQKDVDKLFEDLEYVLNITSDKQSGRIVIAERKEWLLWALRDLLKTNGPDFSIPDDTVKESER